MRRTDRWLRLPGAPIIHDTIDNETIVINQQTGSYYSLDGPAAVVWGLLAGGTTIRGIVDELAGRFDAERSVLERETLAFVDRLIDEGLAVESRDRDPPPVEAGVRTPPADPRVAFAGLELHRYTDLEVLLLVDPIHEVDETGWPKPRGVND